MILTYMSGYREILKEMFCTDLSEDYLMKSATQMAAKYENHEIRYITLKVPYEDGIRVFTAERNSGSAIDTMGKLIRNINNEKFELLPDAVVFEFQDLVGWNLIDAFTTGEYKTHYMTFEKDGKLKQFRWVTVKGDYYAHHYFTHNGERYSRTQPDGFNPYPGNMFDVSKILKGKVISIDGSIVKTEHGEFGWKSHYYGHKGYMAECKEITECPLHGELQYELKGRSKDMADSEAYSKTRYSCIDVLSGMTPSDQYKRNNEFGLWFDLIDTRTGSSAISFFAHERYDYKDLYSKEMKIISELKPLVDKMNQEKSFNKINGLVCENISKLKEALS